VSLIESNSIRENFNLPVKALVSGGRWRFRFASSEVGINLIFLTNLQPSSTRISSAKFWHPMGTHV
jgi:hypothetical protein